MAITAKQLAEKLGFKLKGNGDVRLESVNDLRKAGEGDLSFLGSSKFASDLPSCQASAVILRANHLDLLPPKVTALISEDPYLGFARAGQLLHPGREFPPGVHPSAVIDSSAQLGADVHIGPHVVIGADTKLGNGVVIQAGCVIGESVQIGDDSCLEPNVTILDGVEIGARCVIHPGAVVGADGFGFANDRGRWEKIPQIGGVVIGDDVEVGANTTIDRGAIEDTVISDGTKLDNLIQVAHNVKIGKNTAIAGCTGIAGSATIGSHCAIGGGVGIVGHITIADGTIITGQSFVASDIPKAGSYSSGVPLQETKTWRRNYLRFKSLDDFAKRLKKLEKKLEESND